jgi:hypothetical protein
MRVLFSLHPEWYPNKPMDPGDSPEEQLNSPIA